MNFWLNILTLGNRALHFLGLRADYGHWGVVYDSVSKLPIDPAIVKLIDAQTGKVIQTSFTDLKGRYGFLAMPGRFKIFVRKSNYFFPSIRLSGDHDGIYHNLYRGEFFELAGGTDVIALNIPLDPQAQDWNQQAKQKISQNWPALEYLINRLCRVAFWFFLILAALVYYQDRSPEGLNILYAYAAVLLINFFLPHPRLWGRVVDKKTGQALTDVSIEINHPKIPDILLAKAISTTEGKFFLRVPPGKYLLHFKKDDNLLKTTTITVGPEAVVYKKFRL